MYYYGSVALLLYNQYHYPEPYLYSRPIYIFSCCVALSVFHQYVRITKIIIIMFSIIYAYHYYFTTIIDPPPPPHPCYLLQSACKECPEGFYCDTTIQSDSQCSHGVQNPVPCPVGHYCLNGTEFANQYPCPIGTFNDLTQLEAESECTDCTPGMLVPQVCLYPRYVCTAGVFVLQVCWYRRCVCTPGTFVPQVCLYSRYVCTAGVFVPQVCWYPWCVCIPGVQLFDWHSCYKHNCYLIPSSSQLSTVVKLLTNSVSMTVLLLSFKISILLFC